MRGLARLLPSVAEQRAVLVHVVDQRPSQHIRDGLAALVGDPLRLLPQLVVNDERTDRDQGEAPPTPDVLEIIWMVV